MLILLLSWVSVSLTLTLALLCAAARRVPRLDRQRIIQFRRARRLQQAAALGIATARDPVSQPALLLQPARARLPKPMPARPEDARVNFPVQPVYD